MRNALRKKFVFLVVRKFISKLLNKRIVNTAVFVNPPEVFSIFIVINEISASYWQFTQMSVYLDHVFVEENIPAASRVCYPVGSRAGET